MSATQELPRLRLTLREAAQQLGMKYGAFWMLVDEGVFTKLSNHGGKSGRGKRVYL
jgi:molybdenum-dependent DNA-binding transcriptional regulator ModE